jgi:hypothetical protein
MMLCLAATFMVVIAGAQPGYGQNVTTGTMAGVVMDAQKGVLPGATVVAIHTPTGTTYEAVTANDGHFSFINIRVGGPYTVSVVMPGFRKQEQTAIMVGLGEERKVDFTLGLESVQETVNVVAEALVIDPARAGTAANVSAEAIQNLPTVNRSMYDYARTSPHFVINPVGTDASSISVAGRNDRYNNIQIDGAVNNDVFGLSSSGTPGGTTSTEPISLDAIQELQLVVSAYDVRQGGFSGGSVNAITKSGTNNIKGTVYYFGRNQNLVGVGPNDRKFGTFSNKTFGASVGGPIAKSKLFYFANFELGRKSTPAGASIAGSGVNFGRTAEVDRFLSILTNKYGYNPGNKDEFTRTTNNNKVFIRGDMNISSKHQLTVRNNYVQGLNDIGSPNISSYIFPDSFYRMNSKTNSSVGQLNSNFGTIFNEFRVAYTRVRDFRDNPNAPKPFPTVKATLSDNSSVTAGTEQYSAANQLDQDITELTDDVTIVKGKHTFTVGSHNEFYKFRNLYLGNNYGYYQFSSLNNLEAGLAQSFDLSYGTFDPAFAARFGIRQFGFYAGDQFRVRNNFSLSYGIRFDTPSFPDHPTNNPASEQYFGYRTDTVPVDRIWSPRVGFNWQVSQTRREQVRGGIGIFSGRTPYVWLSNQYGNTGIEVTRPRVSFSTSNKIAFVADALNQPKNVGGAQTNEIDMVDPNYKYPRLFRGNIAYDRELGFGGLVGTAEFIYSRNVQDIKYQNLNFVNSGTTRPDGRMVMKRNISTLSDAIFLTNSDQGSTWSLAFKVDKPWKNNWMASASYLYNRADSIMDGTSSQAASNWGYNLVAGNPNDPPLRTSNFDVRHRINLSLSYQLKIPHVPTTLSMFYNGQSGRPYAMIFYYDVNGDGRTSNDLMYIPNNVSEVVVTKGTADQLASFLAADPCVNTYAGSIMPRNGCRQPWTNQVDFKVSAKVPLGKRSVELDLSVINFLNMFNKDWGKVQYRSNNQNSDISYGGIDAATGKMIYNVSYLNPTSGSWAQWYTDDFRSRWQAQFGARFRF